MIVGEALDAGYDVVGIGWDDGVGKNDAAIIGVRPHKAVSKVDGKACLFRNDNKINVVNLAQGCRVIGETDNGRSTGIIEIVDLRAVEVLVYSLSIGSAGAQGEMVMLRQQVDVFLCESIVPLQVEKHSCIAVPVLIALGLQLVVGKAPNAGEGDIILRQNRRRGFFAVRGGCGCGFPAAAGEQQRQDKEKS